MRFIVPATHYEEPIGNDFVLVQKNYTHCSIKNQGESLTNTHLLPKKIDAGTQMNDGFVIDFLTFFPHISKVFPFYEELTDFCTPGKSCPPH